MQTIYFDPQLVGVIVSPAPMVAPPMYRKTDRRRYINNKHIGYNEIELQNIIYIIPHNNLYSVAYILRPVFISGVARFDAVGLRQCALGRPSE